MDSKLSRRELIWRSLSIGGVAGLVASQSALGDACQITPLQGEGPYYPQHDLKRDNDLTRLHATSPRVAGPYLYLRGKVQDGGCQPIRGAMVEIWQAWKSGKYNHSDDPNPLELNSDFQYWGRAITDSQGRYEFITIIPGHYPVGGGQFRPPHIHFKAHASGFLSLTTQLYFDPQSYDNPAEAEVVRELNRLESVDPRLTVYFRNGGPEAGAKSGEFDLTLRRNA